MAPVAVLWLIVAVPLSASTLTGTVTNATTEKPAAGDDIVLIKLAAGMEEVARAKSDPQGNFTFRFTDDRAPHLVRVIHQGVTYHKPAAPDTSRVDIQVYDVAPKVEGIAAVAELMYVQAANGQLGITRIFAIDNRSRPPRTQMNDHNLEFYLPGGAEIDGAQAQTAGGQGVNVQPVPQAEKGRYALVFPLRPGQSEFQVSYHLPYSGKATIDPRPTYSLQHFVAILPRSIQFVPAQAGIYEDKQPPDQPDAIAEVAANTRPGEKLSFEISGEGVLQGEQQNASTGAGGTTADRRPGGGLGAPTEGHDPMDGYRGWMLGGFGLLLAAGAFYTAKGTGAQFQGARVLPAKAGGTPLLSALKEELFELEMDHKKGAISEQEYLDAKAALDKTLARAIKRHG
jgi:hypothetical protein